MRTRLSREDYEKLVEANKVFEKLEGDDMFSLDMSRDYTSACGKLRAVIIGAIIGGKKNENGNKKK